MATTKKITMREFNGTDYDTLYPKTDVNQVENLTPAAIGAIARSGDTMTGDLRIEKSSPQVLFKNTSLSDGRLGQIVMGSDNTFVFGSWLNSNNRQVLYLTPETSSLQYAARLLRVVDGVKNYYDILHTGNLSDLKVASIATGSYVGTGTYGESNPNTLTFSFEPKFLYVSTATGFALTPRSNATQVLYSTLFWQEGNSSVKIFSDSTYISRSDKTLSWYSANQASQLNNSNVTYYYVAIG